MDGDDLLQCGLTASARFFSVIFFCGVEGRKGEWEIETRRGARRVGAVECGNGTESIVKASNRHVFALDNMRVGRRMTMANFRTYRIFVWRGEQIDLFQERP
jgi:hypothetical protein